MPRVFSKKKSRGGKKEYTFSACGEKIEVGEQVVQEAFR